MTDVLKKLQVPFDPDEIEWRVQSCGLSSGGKPWVIVLAYVQARAIQKRLDDVFGWDGWTDEYRSTGGNMICRLGVKSNDGWIYKENGASETQMEAFKGGISGAFKRVAASGYGIGRYLYNLKESFAECTIEKPKNMSDWKQAKTKDKKTTIYWRVPTLPSWALPSTPITQQQVGILKTRALEFGKMRGKTDAEVFEHLLISDVTQLSEPQAQEVISKLDGWIKKAKDEANLQQKGA